MCCLVLFVVGGAILSFFTLRLEVLSGVTSAHQPGPCKMGPIWALLGCALVTPHMPPDSFGCGMAELGANGYEIGGHIGLDMQVSNTKSDSTRGWSSRIARRLGSYWHKSGATLYAFLHATCRMLYQNKFEPLITSGRLYLACTTRVFNGTTRLVQPELT